jgi:hypothetical protein
MQQYPNLEELGSEIITAASRSTPDGMNVIAVWQPAPGKLQDAYAYLVKRMLTLGTVEGATYSLEVRLELSEALGAANFESPE